MKAVHLYIKPASKGAVVVVSHTFDGGPTPVVARDLIPLEQREAWLQGLLVNADLKAVYNCAGTGLAAPDGLGCTWFDLPAGHACEKL